MSRQLTSASRVDTLRKEAKRWLKGVRSGDTEARARLAEALGAAPADPGLRDIQLALAREHGLSGWAELKAAAEAARERGMSRKDRIEIVLRHGWGGDPAFARRIVERDPGLAKDSLAMAAVCGDLGEVERRLKADPGAAARKSGPLDWEPLLYLAYSRIPGPGEDNAIAIATLLLDHGADPKASFNDGWDNPFTVLCGVIGLGEGAKPPHAHHVELAELLLDRGAEPFDTQALYNTSIVGDDVSWNERLWARSAARGETASWNDPEHKPKLGGRFGLGALDYLLGNAVGQDHVRRAEWLLEHGAHPNAVHAYSGHPLHEMAQLDGFSQIQSLLERYGGTPARLQGAAAFQAACMRMDVGLARSLAAEHPEFAQAPAPMLKAAINGRAEVVELLLSLGANANATEKDGITALHRAVQSGSVQAMRLLVEAGADLDVRERKWKGTPLSWAAVMGKPEACDYLAPISRDIRPLVWMRRRDRLLEVLAQDPSQVKLVLAGEEGPTALFCLPDEAAAAAEMAEVLLRHGVDPGVRNSSGLDAAEHALRRGLDEAGELIRRSAEAAKKS
jgi:ankyrin repeat protein